MRTLLPWLFPTLVCLALLFAVSKDRLTPEEKDAQRSAAHEDKLTKAWNEDFKECEQFAFRRDEARKLLAYDPEADLNKTAEQKAAESQRELDTLDARQQAAMRRWEADTKACLRGLGWSREGVDERIEKDQVRRLNEAKERERERKAK